jgi:GH15 family glucan-1,4-alpha-glucosidase
MARSKHAPIEDYALIGDCETAGLVSRDGSIDWLCWPRFDAESCFASLLGTPEHGFWRIAPTGSITGRSRRYRGQTLVLETRFETADGEVALIDFMPIRTSETPVSSVVRIVEGVRGQVRMRFDLAVRFDYGRIVPWLTRTANGDWRAIAGPHSLVLFTEVPHRDEETGTRAEFTVSAGQRVPFVLTYEPSHRPDPEPIDPFRKLEETEAHWNEWSARSSYDGDWPEAVQRSLITIKALTYGPTGGIVAAPTTSLPEDIGGVRNWDYRYCWLRDAVFTIQSLISAGYRDEAEAWGDWLLRAVAGSACQVQPLYGIAGEHRIVESELDWLPGYRDSKPVRIGNGAYDQLQLDCFGSVMDAFHHAREADLRLHEAGWELQLRVLRRLEGLWDKADEGIWEIRSDGQHFVHSKVLCWVAFDRGVQAIERYGRDGPLDRWRALRAQIHQEVCERGFNARLNAFTQCYGGEALDASSLLIPIVGFLPPDDPRVIGTVAAVERELMRDGLLMRYDHSKSDDGLPGDEGAFLACSFWLVDNMILQGRRDEARELFERLLALRNDVGLLAEEYDTRIGCQVGNFPQAFSHFALIDSALNFTTRSRAAGQESPPSAGER